MEDEEEVEEEEEEEEVEEEVTKEEGEEYEEEDDEGLGEDNKEDTVVCRRGVDDDVAAAMVGVGAGVAVDGVGAVVVGSVEEEAALALLLRMERLRWKGDCFLETSAASDWLKDGSCPPRCLGCIVRLFDCVAFVVVVAVVSGYGCW